MLGTFDNLPSTRTLYQSKLVVGYNIQDLQGTAFLKTISADGQHAILADNAIDRLFIPSEVIPIGLFQPESVSGQPQSFVSLFKSRIQFVDPTLEDLVSSERVHVIQGPDFVTVVPEPAVRIILVLSLGSGMSARAVGS